MSKRISTHYQGDYLAALLLLLGVFVVYLPAIDGEFIFDDLQYIQENPLLHDKAGLWRIWFDPKANPQYYPVTFTTFWVEFQMWGLWPTGYHLTNILVHGLNVLLLWQSLLRLAVPGAWVAAAVFAVHPVQVESVAWIAERKNVLSGFFAFFTLLLYLQFSFLEKHILISYRYRGLLYSLIIVFFLAALLSKTAVCTLPVIILILLWWKKDHLARSDMLPLVPLFVISLCFAGATAFLEQDAKVVGAIGDKWNFNFVERLLIAGRGVSFYLEKILLPVNLSFIYPRWNIQTDIGWQYLFPISICILIAMVFFLPRKASKCLIVSFFPFLATLLPVLGFVDFAFMRLSFVADHFQYLPCISIIASGIGWVWKDQQHSLPLPGELSSMKSFVQPNISCLLISTPILLFLSILTWNRAGVYRDGVTLWTDTMQRNPSGVISYNNLGWEYLQQKDYRNALVYLEKAVELDQKDAKIHSNLSIAYFEIQNLQQALRHAELAVRYAPESAVYTGNLGMIHWKMGDMARAVQSARSALLKESIISHVYYNVGVIALQEAPTPGAFSFAEAVSYIEKAFQLDPDSLAPMHLLAWLRATAPELPIRDGRAALQLAEEACRRTGYRDPNILDTLAAAYAESGQYDVASDTARAAAELARTSGKLRLESRIRDRLALYQARTPYYNTTQEKFPF